MNIMLNDLLKIQDPKQYKLHLATRNPGGVNPLDEYVVDPTYWQSWNEWKGRRNDWTRDYIFSLIEFYPISDAWLFGGVFKILDRKGQNYKIEQVTSFQKYDGRLVLSFHRYQGMRGRAYYFENYIDHLEVKQILSDPYDGEHFCGYENIDHDFNVLEPIFKREKTDWKAALSNIKGVYLICDKSNGKKYVGSAYGDSGIWSRWSCYIGTGHGWNDALIEVIATNGKDYARTNFKFCLLEIMSMNSSDEFILERETYWKQVLLTRTHGYNNN